MDFQEINFPVTGGVCYYSLTRKRK